MLERNGELSKVESELRFFSCYINFEVAVAVLPFGLLHLQFVILSYSVNLVLDFICSITVLLFCFGFTLFIQLISCQIQS